jgi:hypothetical protein
MTAQQQAEQAPHRSWCGSDGGDVASELGKIAHEVLA